MSNASDKGLDRREFFGGLLRKAALAALALGGGAAAAKRAARSGEQSCIRRGICSGCKVFDDCGLPQALSAKEAAREMMAEEKKNVGF
ncbi:MAG: hypothetical protein HQ592_06110 [Planctomycetes bacterium]|nr:hypothetical protein [Planctomycetota bacterium]